MTGGGSRGHHGVHGVLRPRSLGVFERRLHAQRTLTKAGNRHLRTQLVESAWAYQFPARTGAQLRRRQAGLPPEVLARSWTAQVRLCGRFRRLAVRKDPKSVVAAAIARELAGFLWAEMTS